jgi:DNA-binding NarL/FixJ family response regulator
VGPKIEQVLEFSRERLGAAKAATLFAEGREMAVEDAVRYALGSQPLSTPALSVPALSVPALSVPALSVPASRAETGRTDQARPDTVGGPRHDAGGDRRAPSPLTPREHEIVLLIAQGLSNREIADELVISPATAARHVANILGKLGFTSRTQVASWATRHEPRD